MRYPPSHLPLPICGVLLQWAVAILLVTAFVSSTHIGAYADSAASRPGKPFAPICLAKNIKKQPTNCCNTPSSQCLLKLLRTSADDSSSGLEAFDAQILLIETLHQMEKPHEAGQQETEFLNRIAQDKKSGRLSFPIILILEGHLAAAQIRAGQARRADKTVGKLKTEIFQFFAESPLRFQAAPQLLRPLAALEGFIDIYDYLPVRSLPSTAYPAVQSLLRGHKAEAIQLITNALSNTKPPSNIRQIPHGYFVRLLFLAGADEQGKALAIKIDGMLADLNHHERSVTLDGLSTALAVGGHYPEAIVAAKKLIALPMKNLPQPSSRLQALRRVGFIAAKRKQRKIALEVVADVLKVIRSSPSPGVYDNHILNVIVLLSGMGEYDQAVIAARIYEKIWSDPSERHLLIKRLSLAAKIISEAGGIAQADKLIAMAQGLLEDTQKDDARSGPSAFTQQDALNHLFIAHLAVGNPNGADQVFHKLSDNEIRNVVASLRLANGYAKKQMFEKARTHLEHGLASLPKLSNSMIRALAIMEATVALHRMGR